MYKQSGLLVIAALVIASMGILAPTATVTAVVPIPDVTATAPTVTLEPSATSDNGYILMTLTVTNPSDSENIENILIKDVSTGTTANFSGGVFGENVAENMDNVAENLKEAASKLGQVAENFRNAATNIKEAGVALQLAADYMENAGADMASTGRENANDAGGYLRSAEDYLSLVAVALQSEPENWEDIANNLILANSYIENAAAVLENDSDNSTAGTGEDYLSNAGLALSQADENLENVAENLRYAWFSRTSENLENVSQALENAGAQLKLYVGTGQGLMTTAGEKLDNCAEQFRQFNDNLREAAENIQAAGDALENLKENNFDNAASILALATRDIDTNTGLSLLTTAFLDNIMGAAENLSRDNEENLLAAGITLRYAARVQNSWNGTLLASNIIGYDGEQVTNTVRYWLAMAGASLAENEDLETLHSIDENVEDIRASAENMSLTAAASALDNAAALLTAAGENIAATKASLTPTVGWGAQSDESGLLLTSLGEGSPSVNDNHITAGTSKTFKFLWKAPDIADIENHIIRVWVIDNDNTVLGTATDFTVSVDGKPASLAMRVYQENVVDYLGTAVDNVVGTVYNDGKATLEIVASEAVSSLSTVKIENYLIEGDNLEVAFSSLTTTDNTTFTYELTITDWQDNAENVRVLISGPSSTDASGVENENSAELFFHVDLIPPVFAALPGADTDPGGDNGLEQFELLNDAQTWSQLNSDNVYYVSTQLSDWTIKGRAEDNDNAGEEGWDPGDNPDNDLWAITTVYVNDGALTMTRLPDDNYSATGSLVEGVNKIRVVIRDRVGNEKENKLENVFIDNTRPVVEFVSVSDVAWTENGITIKDNKPTFKLKIYDPGFDNGTGMGIPRDNFSVHLDNNDDLHDGCAGQDNLENSIEWENGISTYTFENTFDNENKGIADGTWYIHVWVSDNLHDNENFVMYFVLDTGKPSAPASLTSGVTAGSSVTGKTVITATSVSITGTAEAGGTVKIETSTYNKDGTTITTWAESGETATVDSSGNFTVSISVTQGVITGIRLKVIDSAGNESTVNTFGYVMSDATAPTVSITTPAAGTSTEDTSVAVTGAVTKDSWEVYSDLTLTIQVGTSGVTVPILSDGSFSTSVPLDVGTNTIIATVSDSVNPTSATSVNITRTTAVAAPSPQATEYASYAIILVIVALILAAIAIFRKR